MYLHKPWQKQEITLYYQNNLKWKAELGGYIWQLLLELIFS